MTTIADLMKPYLDTVLPHNSKYSNDGEAKIIVTLPKLKNFSHQKTATFIFEVDVLREVLQAHDSGDTATVDLVGDYVCNRLGDMIQQWTAGHHEPINNVQFRFRVGSEALDK